MSDLWFLAGLVIGIALVAAPQVWFRMAEWRQRRKVGR